MVLETLMYLKARPPSPHTFGRTCCSNFHSPLKLGLTREVVLKAELEGPL